MRLSARSSLPRSAHLALHEAKTSFSSRGNMLESERDFIAHCQGEQQQSGILQGQETKTDGKLLDHTGGRMKTCL